MDYNEIWSIAKEELKTTAPAAFNMFIEPLEPVSFDGNILSLISALALAPQIIKTQHDSKILTALKNAYGNDISYNIVYDEEYAKRYQKAKKKELQLLKRQPEKTEEAKLMDNLAQMQSSANLNLKYKFANFVVGENSRFAHAAAMAVAKNPAQKYNPLFIYGASGLGKTHLMQAIGHYIIFNKPKLKVKYIKTEEYFNELVKSLHTGDKSNRSMDKFHQKYRNIDVLLIDDIQFLESKMFTMEEIFHTFDSLHNNNKQIVITSDRLPKDIPTLTDRLRTRFEMGLVVDIVPPDFETRVAILKNLADSAGIKAEFSVFEYIAMNFVNNVRELEGAFNKVSAYADIEKVDITLEYAKKVLKCDNQKTEITIEDTAKAVAEYFGVSVDDFISSARNQKVSSARQIAVYVAREITQKSFEGIAEFFKKKHTTMLYSYDKIKNELKTNKELENTIKEIRNILMK